MNIQCTRFSPCSRGWLLGFADFLLTDLGLEIRECTVYSKNGKRWINVPSKEYEKEGQKKYVPYIRFIEKNTWQEFMDSCQKSLEIYCAKHLESSSHNIQEPKCVYDECYTGDKEDGKLPF